MVGSWQGKASDLLRTSFDNISTIEQCGLKNGDSVSLHVQQAQILANHSENSLAAVLGDGSVVA